MTAYNNLYAPLAAIAAPVMESYCKRHGYDFLPGPGWYSDAPETPRHERGDLCKAAMYLRYYNDYDILMWLDIDSIIMNHDIKIEDQLGTRPWLWTCDVNGPLSGFWIAITAPLVRQWVTRFAFNCAYEDGGGDQHAMQIIMQRPPFRFIIDNCVYGKQAGHCYDYDVMGWPKDLMFINGYEPGDWIITFPSLDIEHRIALMTEYASRIRQCV